MSKEDIYAEEVARRRLDVQGLRESIPDINATLASGQLFIVMLKPRDILISKKQMIFVTHIIE
jgi:hypothetical protein